MAANNKDSITSYFLAESNRETVKRISVKITKIRHGEFKLFCKE